MSLPMLGDVLSEGAHAPSAVRNRSVPTNCSTSRGDAFQRAKQRNRERVKNASEMGSLRLLLKSEISEISADRVTLQHDGKLLELPNDAIIVNAGGILPTDFLKKIGIEVETKWGTA